MSFVLDSHALLWFLEDSPKLSIVAAAAVESPSEAWFLSAISVAEARLVLRKRKAVRSEAELFRLIEQSGRVVVVPIDYSIIKLAGTLLTLDGIHDQIIVATAMVQAFHDSACTAYAASRQISRGTATRENEGRGLWARPGSGVGCRKSTTSFG